ncbi:MULTISPECIES: hypothetical protein [Prochlorococcus]|uniref:hypothetical protein n=1 Tax=Prochlorococcus TaxID=1218 RepID=UPI0007B398E7|nr:MULTISPECIES: hypothetical protein [Prochlorococcus]KZR67514.1 hypothetical protein PMIT1312_00410 [Prochlorococcus marinus str. MIT 1312]KZR82552.1 hypothetical protein PMIT1327_00815 [Prochlorococcus marinus str. MIT 1327]NMO83118.1 hypothetical protein [Prochlorococcus sp. P1344]NMP05168.1 hypothetical protein [Prochlorococcus sp. P1361]NMP12578.1 hypothetical protein [Prochlorococcus sp.P1363]
MYTTTATVLPASYTDLTGFTKEELAAEYKDKIMAILSNQHSELEYLNFGYQLNQVVEEAQERGISENELKVASELLKVV